jgi:hypothetical protein
LVSWILHSLVVLCVSCSLPDFGSLPDSFDHQTLKVVIILLKTFASFKGDHIVKHTYTYL